MFKFLKRKKVIAANPLHEKAAGIIVAKVLWLQNKWTLFMDRKVNKLSVRSKKFGLMVFVGLSVLICISILIETFNGSHHNSSLQIGHMRKQILQHDEIVPSTPLSQYNRVVAFHKYMDSLSSSNTGRKLFDSINLVRPGLLDSVRILERLYHNQNK